MRQLFYNCNCVFGFCGRQTRSAGALITYLLKGLVVFPRHDMAYVCTKLVHVLTTPERRIPFLGHNSLRHI
jgi:hypothetical protein